MSIPLQLLLGNQHDTEEQSSVSSQSSAILSDNSNDETISFLKTILNHIPNPILVKEAETGKYFYVNQSAEKALGYNLNEIYGKTAYQIFTKELADYYHQSDEELLLNEFPIEIETELRKTKSNTLKIFKTIKSLFVNPGTGIKYIIENCEDITFNKIDSEEADTGEFIFSKLFYSSPIAIAMINVSDNTYIDVNSSFVELTGYNSDEILNSKIDDFPIWKYNSAFLALVESTKSNLNIENQELSLIQKDGSERTALISFECITSEESGSLVILTAIDITERKESDEKMRIALEKQKDLNVLKHRFIHMISHEFRTPLTSIMLSTDLLRRYSDNWTSEEKSKHFDRIQNTVLGMTHLLENVLTVDRLESDRYEFNPEAIELEPFCKSVLRNIETTHKLDKQIIFKYKSECEEVFLDETLVAHILTNLLSNAVKYSSLEKDIVLDTEVTVNEVVFTVMDFGIGIPKEDLQNLFETFYRASNITTTAGYGLGLGIVKKCVELHRGKIMVDSQENLGTTFTIKLPNSQAQPDDNNNE